MRVQDIARRLQERMKAEGWTQVAVSKATGVHQSQISRFRAGKFAEPSDNLRSVCEYAGIHLDEPVVQDRDQDLHALLDRLVASHDTSKRAALETLLRSLLELL